MRLRFLLLCLAILLVASAASAQATRTWVSGVGDDVNPCSRTAPCKTFAGAISKTASPGIINCLDPGGFGAVTITKSITIDCTGTLGSILSSGVQGVIINALSTDRIVLRSIDINGAGTTLGTNGISILQAGRVAVEDVNVANYSTTGIRCNLSTGSVNLSVVDSDIIQNQAAGIDLVANCKAEIQNTRINQNLGAGVVTEAPTTDANIAHSFINNNSFGVSAGTNSVIFLFASQLSHNNQSVNTFGGGVVNSHGNNAILNNTTNIVPPNVNTQ
jgi:hypothetical protein